MLAQLSKLSHIPVMLNKACEQNESLSLGCNSPHTWKQHLLKTALLQLPKRPIFSLNCPFSPQSPFSFIFLITTRHLTSGKYTKSKTRSRYLVVKYSHIVHFLKLFRKCSRSTLCSWTSQFLSEGLGPECLFCKAASLPLLLTLGQGRLLLTLITRTISCQTLKSKYPLELLSSARSSSPSFICLHGLI